MAGIDRDPKTWANARSAGVSSKKIDEYLDLLVKLDANEELVGVAGLGKTCLIVADIAPWVAVNVPLGGSSPGLLGLGLDARYYRDEVR